MSDILVDEVVPTAIDPAPDTSPEVDDTARPDEGDDNTSGPDGGVPVNRLTAAIAAGISSAGAAWMVSGIFRDPLAHLVALAGVLIGSGIVVLTYRVRRGALFQFAIIPAAVLLSLVLVAPQANSTTSVVDLVLNAIRNGGLLQPPVPFDPGWRAILVVVFAVLSGAASALGAGLDRPKLGVFIPVPLAMAAAIVQPASTEVLSVAISLMLIVLAMTIAYGASMSGGADRSFAFQLRRSIRGAGVALGVAVLIVTLSSFGFLFPQPNTSRVVPPQRPQVPPAQPDHVIFTYSASRLVPLRLGVIDVYDPVQQAWLLPPYDATRVQRINAPASLAPDGSSGFKPSPSDITVSVTVNDDTSHALPDIAGMVRIQGSDPTFGFDPRTDGLTIADQLAYPGLHYTVVGLPLPTGDQLAAAAAPPKSLAQYLAAPPVPVQVSALLQQYAKKTAQLGIPADAWDRLQFVRQAFYSNVVAAGPGVPEDLPAYRVVQMLNGGDANPYEIVAAEALLARWAGVPSRIGYGYYGGVRQHDGSIQVHPVDGAMWVEVYFSGHGWVPVIGVPPKAKPSTSTAQKNQVDIPSTGLGQLIVYIPSAQPSLLQLFEVVQYWLVRVVPLVALFLVLLAGYPWMVKRVRRRRRRAWARAHGLRGRIAVAYVEFRDLARDLTIGDPGASPVGFVGDVAADPEHRELAWLVTRALWGDLRRDLRPEDAAAAERLARSVGSRLDRAQGGLDRLLARMARTSLRAPYSLDVPNLWWEPRLRPHLRLRVDLRGRRRARARSRALAATAATVIALLALVSCGGSGSTLTAARTLPTNLVPAKIGAYSFPYEAAPSKLYALGGSSALVSSGRVYSIHEADATVGAVETSVFKPTINVDDINDESMDLQCYRSPADCQGHEVVIGMENSLGVQHFQRLYYHDQRAYEATLSDQRIYVWFPPHTQTMVMLILLSQFTPSAADAMFHAILDTEQGRRPGNVPIPSIAAGSLGTPAPSASPQVPTGVLPSQLVSPSPTGGQ